MGLLKVFDNQNLTADGLPSNLERAENICSFLFSVLWTRDGSQLTLVSLNARLAGSSNWHQIITHAQTDNDGEITVKIGDFPKGTVIDLIYSIFPLQDIHACGTFVVNATEHTHKLINQKQLLKGKVWNDFTTQKLS